MSSRILTLISLWLAIIGAFNWGLVGLFEFNLVGAIFGEATLITRLIYILVGLSGLWLLLDLFRDKAITK